MALAGRVGDRRVDLFRLDHIIAGAPAAGDRVYQHIQWGAECARVFQCLVQKVLLAPARLGCKLGAGTAAVNIVIEFDLRVSNFDIVIYQRQIVRLAAPLAHKLWLSCHFYCSMLIHFWSYAVALFRIARPHFCLRQHGTCRSFMCGFSALRAENRIHEYVKYRPAWATA
jgi:hypothetical protein